MSSLEKPKSVSKSKATSVVKGVTTKQIVNVNVPAPEKEKKPRKKRTTKKPSDGRKGKRANKSNLGNDPAPKYYQPVEYQSIGSRQPLVNTVVNSIPADKNVVADPVKYLESSIPVPPTKSAVRVKKGQNPLDVEVELQQEVTEVTPNAKGKGLAENVERQTEVRIEVDKPKRGRPKKIPVEPANQFVDIKPANTDKVVSYDTQAEGDFEKNAEKGMTAESEPAEVKKDTLTEREDRNFNRALKSLRQKGVVLNPSRFAFGKIIGVVEGEEDLETLLFTPGLNGWEKKVLTYLKQNPQYYRQIQGDKKELIVEETVSKEEGQKARAQAQSVVSEVQEHRNTERSTHSRLFPQNEAYASKKFVDSSLGKLYENQFDDQVNYSNDTNNNPVKQNLAELSNVDVPADNDVMLVSSSTNTNYSFI